MAKLRINGDSSGYVDLEAPNAASSSTLDLDQVPQKNVTNTFSTINKFADSVAIGGTHSPSNNLDVRSTGQVIVRVDGSGLYYNGIKIRNNYSSVQSDWNVGAAGGTSGWGSANGTFIIRDDTTNSTGLEIEQGAGSNTAALLIKSSGAVTTPNQPVFMARKSADQSIVNNDKITFESAIVNKGSHYNATNNRFTAPVDGTYSFSINLRCGIENNARVLTTAIYKNGSSLYGRFAGAGGIANFSDGGSYDHPYISGTIILPLNANDYIEIYFGAENSYSGNGMIQSSANSSYFMGHLIG